MPIAIQEGAATVEGDRLFVVGGYDERRQSSAAVFVLDSARWSAGPSLPVALNHLGAATIGYDVYAAGGFTAGGASNRVFVLDRNTVRWRELSPMRRARGALALLSIGGRLYAIGGRDGSAQIAIPEVYDPSAGTWRDLPPMPHPRNHAAGFINAGRACVAGGRTPFTSARIDCLDVSTTTWSELSAVPTATSGAAAATLGATTVVAGGEPSAETGLVDRVQKLHAGTWSAAPMLLPRHGTAYATYRGRLWACGGATAPGFQAVARCTSMGP